MYLINNATALRSISPCAATRSPSACVIHTDSAARSVCRRRGGGHGLQPRCSAACLGLPAQLPGPWWLDYRASRVHLELSFLGHLEWHSQGSAAVRRNHGLNTDRMKERSMQGEGEGGGGRVGRGEWARNRGRSRGSVTWARQGGREDRQISWKYLHTHSGRGCRISEENIKMHI